jgi:simple sugar transport system substrate-binding protein
MGTTRRTMTGILAGVTLAGLAACSSSGGAQEEAGGGSGGVGSVDTERYTIAMVAHAPEGDTFWDRVRTGAETAAQALNVELEYSTSGEAPEQATLVQNSIDRGVDGLAVTLAYPEAVGPLAQQAADSGTPVVAFNAGIDVYEQYGASMYFGSDETVAGQSVGERLTEIGAEKAICVIQAQGVSSLEARCEGVTSGFGNTEILYVEGTDLPTVRSTIGAKLQQDPSVTHVVTLGAPIALAALDAVADAGSDAEVATFDLNTDVAQRIADGDILFSVDQQPYVQGFLAVQALWLDLTNGNDIGGGQPVLTGPSFVDETNIEQILPYAEGGTR